MSELIVPFGNLKLNYYNYQSDIDKAIHDVLNSGWFILGKTLERFESVFTEYCGLPYGIGVGSGTEALHIALVACGLQPGDEVITVANTCVPTLAAISFAGGVPVLVDIDPDTQTMDPYKIEERINNLTKVILPVHLYGQCADMDLICSIAAKNNLLVIEDCAQAHGASLNGQIAGSMGDAGCYSFYPSKNLGAFGDAGIIVCKDAGLAERMRSLRNYGQTQRYYHKFKGFNSRLDEIQAGILLAKLQHLEACNKRRREIATVYSKSFKDLDWITTPIEKSGHLHVYHLYVVRVGKRQEFQDHMLRHGVATLIHYPIPIHRQPAYRECFSQAKYLPVTDSQAPQLISLPIYPELTDAQVEHVIATVGSWRP